MFSNRSSFVGQIKQFEDLKEDQALLTRPNNSASIYIRITMSHLLHLTVQLILIRFFQTTRIHHSNWIIATEAKCRTIPKLRHTNLLLLRWDTTFSQCLSKRCKSFLLPLSPFWNSIPRLQLSQIVRKLVISCAVWRPEQLVHAEAFPFSTGILYVYEGKVCMKINGNLLSATAIKVWS